MRMETTLMTLITYNITLNNHLHVLCKFKLLCNGIISWGIVQLYTCEYIGTLEAVFTKQILFYYLKKYHTDMWVFTCILWYIHTYVYIYIYIYCSCYAKECLIFSSAHRNSTCTLMMAHDNSISCTLFKLHVF